MLILGLCLLMPVFVLIVTSLIDVIQNSSDIFVPLLVAILIAASTICGLWILLGTIIK